MKKIISTGSAPAAIGPYSQAVEANGTLYVSGQTPINPADGTIPEGIEAQTRRSLENLGAILKAAGYDFADAVKVTVMLSDMNDFSDMNSVYAEFFTGKMPARVCFQAARLPKDVKVEIDLVAVRDRA